MISESALRGYVLEEILARLLRDNGYSLLVTESQDLEALKDGPHGLLVRGRGANHQADAVGELQIPTPFSLPVRLFAEAKFREHPIDITAVRNAIGLLSDVNEYHRSDVKSDFPLRRYHYRYALFSTSGFTADAQQYALAHQVSLIDLQGPAFQYLRTAAGEATAQLLELATQVDLISFPVHEMRYALRHSLGTWTADRASARDTADDFLAAPHRAAAIFAQGLTGIGDELAGSLADKLILGFPHGPFILVLQPDDPLAFEQFLNRAPGEVPVRIRYASRTGGISGEWAIEVRKRDELVVRFGVPPLLEAWLLAAGEDETERARLAKQTLFSNIAVFHHGNRLTRLRYMKSERIAAASTEAFSEAVPSPLRRELADPKLAFTPDRRERRLSRERMADRPAHPHWTRDGIKALLSRLDHGGYYHAEVIRAAARQRGSVSREQVYEIASLPQSQTLNGFYAPINRVMRELQHQGIVLQGVGPVLRTRHGPSGRATRFEIPPEVLRLINVGLADS
jgi:hypothetical protein